MCVNKRCLVSSTLVLLLSLAARAQVLSEFEKQVTEFTLDNGLHFIVVERHEAPVVSFHTFANVGGVDEVKGITGMAHVFEHMAFKGTSTVGTKDIEKELTAMQKVDKVYERLRSERHKGVYADTALVRQLVGEFKQAQAEAKEWVQSNEVGEAIDRNGGVGLNASTAWDWTRYYYSLPSNKTELWFSLESDRFLDPVLREFYTEVEVVMEERRLRTESQPFGRLVEEFFSTAYKAHPYGEPVVGHMSDLRSMTRDEAMAFFKRYYGANNLIIAIVGDVDPQEVRKLAATYFDRLPTRPKPDPVETIEPAQLGERRVVVEDKSQPIVILGYHKGNIHDKDAIVFDVMGDIMGRGRSSRLYKALVKDRQVAIEVSNLNGYPGEKYPNLSIFYAVSSKGNDAATCEAAILDEIERLKNELVTPDELQKAKTRARADLLRQLNSNTGMALQLAYYQGIAGDWRVLFNRLDQLNAVSAEDIQRVAKTYLTAKNRTVASIVTIPDVKVAEADKDPL